MKKKTPKRELPRFRSEDQEREVWSKSDSSDYVDWERAKRMALPKLKPTRKRG